VAVDAQAAADVPVVAAATIIKATPDSLANRAGSNFLKSCTAPLN
jgi:hypothetical protein